jgi:hypothetical protein
VQIFDVVCLANSSKLGGRCVAGLRTDGGGWIRPIGHRSGGQLYSDEYTLEDGSDAQVLDVVQMELERLTPDPVQPENWLISDSPWRLIQRPASSAQRDILLSRVHQRPELFGSTSDRAPETGLQATPPGYSLAIVRPDSLRWYVDTRYTGGLQGRADFTVMGQAYDLAVTDPYWASKIKALGRGYHDISKTGISESDDVLLTVSLGEPLNGICYKLVAAIFKAP